MMRSVAAFSDQGFWYQARACGRIGALDDGVARYKEKRMAKSVRGRYRPIRFVLLASVLGGLSSVGCLADDPLAASLHRQAVMDGMADDVKAIKLYLQGNSQRAAAITASQDLQAKALIVPTLFPKGSDSGALPGKSAAKPEIWDNPDDFQQLEAALKDNSKALSKAIDGGDPTTEVSALRSLGRDACGACHQTYRGSKDGG